MLVLLIEILDNFEFRGSFMVEILGNFRIRLSLLVGLLDNFLKRSCSLFQP